MKYTIALFFFCFLSSTLHSQKNVELIIAKDLKEMIVKSELQIVDVRTAKEFKSGFIKGAVNIDYWDPEFSNLIKSQFDKKKPLIVYCAGGGRSAMACDKLSQQGFKILLDVDGGYEAYID